MKKLLIFLLCIITNTAISQKHIEYIDSLQKTLILNIPASQKIENLFNAFEKSLGYDGPTDQILDNAKRLVSFARKEKDPKYAIYIYTILTATEKDPKKVSTAMDSCIYYVEKSNDNIVKAFAYQILGNKDTDKAIAYHLKGVELLKKEKGKKALEELILMYSSLGAYYRNKKDPATGLKYMELSLESAEKSGSPNLICKTWGDLATIYAIDYIYPADGNKNPEIRDKALEAFNKGIEIYKSNPKETGDYRYTQLIGNMASLLIIDGQTDKSIKLLEESIRINEKNNFNWPLINNYLNIGEAWKNKKEYNKALEYSLKSLELYSKIKNTLTSYNIEPDINLNIAALYTDTKEYEKAVEYYIKGISAYKESFNKNLTNISKELEAKYQFEQHEQEIKYLKEQEKSKRIQNYLYITLVIILLTGLIFVYNSFRYKLKYSKEKNLSLQQEKRLKEEEAKLLNAEKEKAELNAHLQEELNIIKEQKINLLKKEMLVGNLHLEHKNHVLQELKEKLSKDKSVNFSQIENSINQEIRLDSDFEGFRSNLRNIHPEFYKNLQEKANNKLTSLDLKYCTCVFMNLDSYKTAAILNIEPKSVRMGKYRLKQKLGLSKEDDLSLFIQNIIS